MATKAKAPKKRIGRPTKPPEAGERVPLGLRVTPEMKKRLERAAIRKGRSLSQEAEMRTRTFAGTWPSLGDLSGRLLVARFYRQGRVVGQPRR